MKARFVRDIWHKYHSWYFKIVSNFTRLTAREITYNNFEISLVVFMPNITTNHAFTYTYWIISSACSILTYKNIYVEKYCNFPLTTTQGDRFASCENVVPRSQTSPLPPSDLYILRHI